VIGESEVYKGKKTVRMFVHWHGTSDIDLSGLVIDNQNNVTKVGWNGRHEHLGGIVYSGDNTGYAQKNAEYLDINIDALPSNIEWIITEARIYSGPSSYKAYNGKVHAGWMETNKPQANSHWQPEKLTNARVLSSDAKNAYLMAFHVPTQNIVYLDMAMGQSAVSNDTDALRMRMFLETFITLDKGSDISWDRLNQGHLLELRLNNIVGDSKEADVVFDANSNGDEISTLITA